MVRVRVPFFFFLQVKSFFNGLDCFLNNEDSPTSVHSLSLEFHIHDLFHISTFILSNSYIVHVRRKIFHQTNQFLKAYSFLSFFLFFLSLFRSFVRSFFLSFLFFFFLVFFLFHFLSFLRTERGPHCNGPHCRAAWVLFNKTLRV